MDQVLSDAGGQLDLLTYDANADLADVDTTNAPTIAVTDSAGIAVTGFTPSRTSAGTYKATLPSNLETLDRYDAVWTWPNAQSRRSEFELVRRHLFTIADLQTYDAALANETTYPVGTVRKIRSDVTERFEAICNRSFVPRGHRAILDGDGTSTLILAVSDVERLASAKVDGTALSAGDLAKVKVYGRGTLYRDGAVWTEGKANVEVLVEYGFTTPPEPITRAAMRLARHLLKLNTGQTDERASAVFNEIGGYRLTMAGRDGPTGLPEVDGVLAQYGLLGTAVG